MSFYGFQSSFTAGELSPSLSVRVDLARYQTGCSLLENMLVHPHGGASKRSGFRYLAELEGKARLMPFIFSPTETYMLVWTEKKLSFFTAEGQVLDENKKPYALITPFSYETARKMNFVQSADVVYLVSEDFPPYKLSRFAHDNWTLEEVDFNPKLNAPTELIGTLYDVRTNSEISSDGTGKRNWQYVVTCIDENGEESLASTSCAVEGPENLRQTCYPKLTWQACSKATEYRIYQEKNGKYGYIGSSLVPSFDAKNIAPDMTECPPEAVQPFSENNYPSCVCFYQQRLVFAGSKKRPQTLWFSRTGNFESFSHSSPIRADDSMEISIAGNEVSRINWLVSLRTLLVGTGGTEWEVKSSSGTLTAQDISLVPQSYRGSGALPALIVGNSVLHINRTHKELRDLMYDFGSDSYSGSDHAVLAGHLFENHSILDWTYQQSPNSIVWCVRDDGVLLGHTFLREHEVFAWHKHKTQGKFMAVCSLPANHADELFCVTERNTVKGVRYFLECMEKDEYVDCALFYHADGESKKLIRYVGGLEHLYGENVAICADGAVCPSQIVREIFYTDNGEEKSLIGIDLGYYAKNIAVGLSYNAKLQSMSLEAEGQFGSSVGRNKAVRKIGIHFQNTNFAKVGADFENMDEIKWRCAEKPGEPVNLHTGYASVQVTQGYAERAYACVMSDVPLPLTVQALLPEFGVGI